MIIILRTRYRAFLDKKQLVTLKILAYVMITAVFLIYTLSSRIAPLIYMSISMLIAYNVNVNSRVKILKFLPILIIVLILLMGIKTYVRNYLPSNLISRVPFIESDTAIKLEIPLYEINNLMLNTEESIKSHFDTFFVWEGSRNEDNFRIEYFNHKNTITYFFRKAINRLDHLSSTNYLTSHFPSEYQYLGLKQFEVVMSTVIPRFFYENKPINIIGHEFPIKYGLLPINDLFTSVNINVIEEGWVTYGYIGIIYSSVLFSVCFFLAFSFSNSRSRLLKTIYPICCFTLLNSESGLFGLLGGVIHSVLIFFVLIYLVELVIEKNLFFKSK